MKKLIISTIAAAVVCSSALGQELKPGDKIWSFRTGSSVYSSPSIGSDGTIYVASRDSNLYAFNPDSARRKKWAYKTGSDVMSSPAIGSDGTLYFGSDDGYFYAIKTSNEDPVEAQPAEIAIDTYAGVMIEGTVGVKYRVEFKDKLDDAAKWIVGDVITLPESPYLWVDRFKPVRETRYYRVVLVE